MSDKGHVVTVTYQRAWDEYRPDCSCGWCGSYWISRHPAELEGERHCAERAEATP